MSSFCFFFSAVGIFLFSFLCISGSALFALGSHFKGTPFLLPLMLTGRLLLGAGSGSVVGKKPRTFGCQRRLWGPLALVFAPRSVLQDRMTAFWFKEKELAMAFGVTIGFSRFGSVMNFFVTKTFEQAYGLQWTLWGGSSQNEPSGWGGGTWRFHTPGFALQVRCCVLWASELRL